jgi:hypothetical protein
MSLKRFKMPSLKEKIDNEAEKKKLAKSINKEKAALKVGLKAKNKKKENEKEKKGNK